MSDHAVFWTLYDRLLAGLPDRQPVTAFAGGLNWFRQESSISSAFFSTTHFPVTGTAV